MMEVYYRELREMSSSERKRIYREMERTVAAQRPSFLERVRASLRHLGLRVGAPR
jgi:hypothetical protein